MNAQYLNSLKAGIKTAVIVFITSLVGVLTQLYAAVQSWSVDGNPPDPGVLKSALVSAVIALGLGVGNVVLRFVQAAGVPLFGTILDKIIGVIPDYLPPPEAPVDELGPNVGLNRDADKGFTSLQTVVLVLAAILAVVLIIHFVDVNVK